MRRLLLSLLLSTILVINLFSTPAWATSVYDFPPPDSNTWVIDQADIISRANEGKLSTSLADLAKNTGNEVRIVVLRRLDYGENIDSFSNELFETWFSTPETQSNQTLVVLDSLTNNAALRRGENAQTLLDDAKASSVLEQTIQANLKQGNKYNQAILETSDRLVAILSGQNDPGPTLSEETLKLEGTFTEAEDTKKGSATLWVIGLLVLATIIPMATYFFYVGFSN
jgi:uncharacterized protein